MCASRIRTRAAAHSANTQFPIVIGGQSRYETTGEPTLREAAVHFFELIRDTRSVSAAGLRPTIH